MLGHYLWMLSVGQVDGGSGSLTGGQQGQRHSSSCHYPWDHQERSVCPLHRSEEQGKETPPCFRGHIFCPAATWTMWLAVFKRNREWMLRWSTLTRSKPSRSPGNSSTSCSGAEWRGRGVATHSRSRPSLDMHSDGGSGSSRAESLNQNPLTKVVSVIPGTPTT